MSRYPCDSRPKLTQEIIDSLSDAIRKGAYIETAVALCGISKQSFYRWLKDAHSEDSPDPMCEKLSDAIKRANADFEVSALGMISNVAFTGTWQASAWILERRFPHRWGRRFHLQVQDSEWEAIEKATKETMTVEEESKFMTEIMEDPEAFAALERLNDRLDHLKSTQKVTQRISQ